MSLYPIFGKEWTQRESERTKELLVLSQIEDDTDRGKLKWKERPTLLTIVPACFRCLLKASLNDCEVETKIYGAASSNYHYVLIRSAGLRYRGVTQLFGLDNFEQAELIVFRLFPPKITVISYLVGTTFRKIDKIFQQKGWSRQLEEFCNPKRTQ